MLFKLTRILLFSAFLLLPLTFIKVFSNLSISDILIAISFFTLSISSVGKRFLSETVVVKNEFTIPLIIFSIGFLISINNSVYILESITAYIQIIFIFLIAYPVISEVLQNEKQIRIGVILLIIPGIIISILMMMLKFLSIDLGLDLLAYEGWRGRFSYGGMEPNVPGRIILQNIPLLAVFLLTTKKIRVQLILGIFIIIQLLAIFLTSSRSNMLAFVLGLLLFVIFMVHAGRNLKPRQLLLTVIIFTTLLLVPYSMNKDFFEKPFERYSTILNPQKSASSLERLKVINMGMDYLNQNPVSGLGLGNSYLYTDISLHNPILLTWLENGILGVIGFTWLYFLLLKRGFIAYKHKFFNNDLLIGLTIVAVLMVFGDMFMANSYKRVLWLPALLLMVHLKNLNLSTK